MRITVIGYWGAYPEKNEATTGYLLQSGDHNILVDCGSGILSKVQEYIPLNKIDSVMLSHYHGDHAADVIPLQYEAGISKKLSKRDKEIQIYGHNLSSEFKELTSKGISNGNKIDDNIEVTIGKLKVTFKWVKHPVPTLAMRFEEEGKVFAYSGDTEWCEGVIDIAKDADLFICETSLYNNQLGKVKGHLTAGEVGKIGSMNNVKKLVLSHLPHYGNLDDLVKEAKEEFNGEVYKAYSGLSFEL
ncbi:MBL fold metallo-hydrolase [Clostridium botulinum]|uniref:Metallo-beta-lactamase n=1 Tax=Clostridium botulinum C/D str. DC5 TaxID=1443128 RepID=A0A0A0IHQ5_CLOBO|nr:MBL fold metallo-hydrolase [Clostridium botulinum]KGM99736.1 metallo-beta-lactamase [Clostridium botulinum C/D str. DC5]KOC53760.1 metallo-beta-lactamase [Clostridium botulinum]KOC55480.1 metallo-beta-lactamase [Clostridium botulinum]MCD3235081.1 MBL fold metallo-hydrolase [Clostridium botulinum D/C]MCD3241002.1 MBL fold metallo-hydrolase [Clostridium botulinum D/C]